ncbi:DNA polymerase IV [bacterium]|nr:DNA polymerase IV [bacterium]
MLQQSTQGVTPAETVVMHVDMDCFYVSVERLLDPSLNGLPVAVGGSPDGRGVVSSASYEARRFGVRSAMPMGQAMRLCPQLVVVRGSYGMYAKHSAALAEIFRRYAPVVRMASQDEAYLDLTGTGRLYGTPLVAAERLRRDVLAETRLPCSIGIGSNRLVAKVASDLCKPKGLLWVPPGSEERFLAPLPIERIPGVGHRIAERLHAIGARRVGDVVTLGAATLDKHFGEHGRDLYSRCSGVSSAHVTEHEPAKSIGAEETFDRDCSDAEVLDASLSALSEKVASRLRAEGIVASTITLKYRFHDFETHTAATTLAYPVDDELAILEAARGLLAAKWGGRRAIRLLGVTTSGLTESSAQLDLLAEEGREKRDRLHAALDRIRGKHGYGGIRRASSEGTS